MPVIKGLGWTFDTVAATYEKFRPGYAAELYDRIFDYKPIGRSSRLAEIGIGAGQATLPFLQKGCSLTAIDPGENFSELCREKFKDFPGFRAVTGKFEDAEVESGAYDLVYSASAFHWVPEEAGYAKVLDILKSGGAFARFANHPYQDKGRPALAEEIQELYAAYYNKFHKVEKSVPKEWSEEQAAQRAETARKYGFEDIEYALFRRTRTFTAKEYIRLLGTYSDHIVIEEKIRAEFFSKIEEAIERHGGEISIYDTMDLQLARKP